jgi:hypothetical protein
MLWLLICRWLKQVECYEVKLHVPGFILSMVWRRYFTQSFALPVLIFYTSFSHNRHRVFYTCMCGEKFETIIFYSLILEPCHCCSARNSSDRCKALTSLMQGHISYKWHTLLLRTTLLLSFVGLRSWNIKCYEIHEQSTSTIYVLNTFSEKLL